MLLAGQSSRCGWQGGALDWSNFRGQPNPAPGPEATGKIADFAGPQSSSFGNSTVTRSRTPAIIFLLLVWPSGLLAKEFTGRVVGVTDGDTISVLHAGRAEKIRLYGIDAPERGQPFTHSAKEFVSKLCFGKEVTREAPWTRSLPSNAWGCPAAGWAQPESRDRQTGFAWWFRQYAPHDTKLEKLEKGSRQLKRGLWSEPDPVPPWEWRRQKPTAVKQ